MTYGSQMFLKFWAKLNNFTIQQKNVMPNRGDDQVSRLLQRAGSAVLVLAFGFANLPVLRELLANFVKQLSQLDFLGCSPGAVPFPGPGWCVCACPSPALPERNGFNYLGLRTIQISILFFIISPLALKHTTATSRSWLTPARAEERCSLGTLATAAFGGGPGGAASPAGEGSSVLTRCLWTLAL